MSTALARLNPETLPDVGKSGYSQISIADTSRLAFISGQVAWKREGGAVPGTLSEQTTIVINNLNAALSALNATPRHIAQMRIYMTDLETDRMESVMAQVIAFLDGAQPSLTGIGVAALAAPELEIEIEMTVQMPH
ncbi:MAG: RidA family protein [Sneathiellales bacterium]|nr:RidA family protein [Sneathiellales bacterium]